MTDDPRAPIPPEPGPGGSTPAPASESEDAAWLEPGDPDYVPPDPDEPPPVELGRVGDVLPWGTVLVLLTWGLVFLWFALRRETDLTEAYVAWGANVSGRPAAETAWRLVASTFLHAGIAHAAMNAVSLLLFGASVESVFSRWAFWIAYAAGGACASLGSLAWHAWRDVGTTHVSVGGSGAIFALGGVMLASALRLRSKLAVGRARALAAGALFLLTQSLVAGFSHLGTDNAAHAAGLGSGFFLGLFLPITQRLGGRAPGWPARVAGSLAVAVVLAALGIAVAAGLRAGY